jgi:PAS domain S-box-containing protein
MERFYDVGTFQAVLDALDDGCALFDRDDRLALWNRRYQAQLPVGRELLEPGIRFAVLLRSLAERGMFPAAEGRIEAWLAERLAGFRSGGGFQEPLSDGAIAEARAHLLPDGGLLIAVRDVTELKRAEQALRDSEARFRDFADTASDWYWETGPDLRFTYMSDRIRNFGLDPASRIGRSRLELAADAIEDPGKWEAHVEAMQRREPFRDFQYKMQLGNEEAHYMSVSGKPVFDAQGAFLGYRGSAVEVTERSLAAERLRQAKNAAEAASAAKSKFLAHMSHELRTPLNAIIGFATILADQPAGRPDPVKTAEYARDIRESGMHLLALINDILDLSKIEAGKMTMDETQVVVPLVLDVVLRLVRSRAEAGRIVIETSVDDDLPGLHADEMHMRQIVVNLVSNAIKFTPPGGRVAVRGWRTDDGAVAISVSDTGVGMAEADLARLGTPFYRTEARDGRNPEGTGLGLSLTKEMVKLHGGALAITSELGRGTTVTVTFPADRSLPRG